MVVENNIEIPDEDSGFGIFLLSSLSSSCLLLIILIIVGVFFYYKSKNINIFEFPFLEKFPFLQKIPFLRNLQSDDKPVSQESQNSKKVKNLETPPLENPNPLSSTSSTTKSFDKNTGNQMLLQQASDMCSSAIADGLCGNLVKGDCSFSVTTDGNLVLKLGSTTLWESFTNKQRPNTTYSLNLTNTANLILLDNNWNIIWSNNLNGKKEDGPYTLILRDDNNVVIENNAKQVIWETGTSGGKESTVITERGKTGLAGPSDTSGYLLYKDVVSNLPLSFRLETSLSPTDQYDVATCVTSQVLGIFTYYYWKLFNKEYWFSRLFTWHYNQLDNGANPSENLGSSVSSVYQTIRNKGLLLEKYYQYDGTIPSGPSGTKNTCSVPKYQEKPQDELLDIAKKNIPQFTVYSISVTPNLDTLKSAIFNGMPVLCGIVTYSSYSSTATNTTGVISYPDKTKEKKNSGAHQVSLWGWDDDKRIFHLLNTRGSDYMNKGWCTIPYEYILDPELSFSFECFKLNTPVVDIVDDPNYVNKEDWVFKKNDGCVYVNTVQKGLQCFEPPPPGYDWTTPGGILIGKICPPGSNDSGTTCWYDRGVGRMPDKRPCADGERDTPTECWLDTYGVGAGRGADLGPCPPRSYSGAANDCYAQQTDREDGRNDSEPWGKSWDKSDGCSWNRHIEAGACFRACPEGFFGRAYEKCWANGADSFGVMRRAMDRYQCNADEDKNGLMCYPKCKSGYRKVGCCLCEPDGGPRVTAWLKDRQYCADDEEMKDGLCYKKCKPGFNAGVTICEFSKEVKSGTFKKAISNCK